MQVAIRITPAATRADAGFLRPHGRREQRFLPALASSAVLHGALAVGVVGFLGVSKKIFPYEDYRPRFPASVMVELSPVAPAPDTRPDTKRLEVPKEAADSRASARSVPDQDRAAAPAAPPEPPAPARVASLPPLQLPLPIRTLAPVITETPASPAGGFQAVLEMALPFPNLLPPGIPPQDDPLGEAIWKRHSPSGSYDVVIVQSAASMAKRFGAGALSGTVYVVYLDVGLPRMSTLQFSVPTGTGPIVDLDGDDIAAPYPSLTVVPKSAQNPRDAILVHGFVTTEGRLRDLSILGNSQLGKALLAMLESWVFRPAKRGDRLVEVEIVLAI